MNIAQLIGELDSAVGEAREAGERVRKAIENLKEIFGSLVGESVSVIEPTISLNDLANDEKIPCPYCGRLFDRYRRRHRDSPHFRENFRVVRHVSSQRQHGKTDHGELKSPVPR